MKVFIFILWLLLGLGCSIFWGVYGWNKKVEDSKSSDKNIEKAGIALSEFFGSFAGWCCLLILSIRLHKSYMIMSIVDIFLIIGAVIGIAGFSYKIVELVDHRIKK